MFSAYCLRRGLRSRGADMRLRHEFWLLVNTNYPTSHGCDHLATQVPWAGQGRLVQGTQVCCRQDFS